MSGADMTHRRPRFASLGALMSPSRHGAARYAGATAAAARQARRDPVAAARAEERQRIADVFASEYVRGRESMAALLLASTSMGAKAIVAMLPRVKRSADIQAEARRELGALGPARPARAENHGWAKTYAKVKERI